MTDRVAQSYHGEGTSSRPYQSAWMAHWTRTNGKSESKYRGYLSANHNSWGDGRGTKNHHVLDGPEMSTDFSKHSKGFGQVAEAKTTDIVDESLTVSSKKARKEKLNFLTFPMYNLPQNRGSATGMNDSNHRGVQKFLGSDSGNDTLSLGKSTSHSPSKEFTLKRKGIGGYQEKPKNSKKLIDHGGLAVPVFLEDKFTEPASKHIPYENSSGVIPLHSSLFTGDSNNLTNSNLSTREQVENTNCCSFSTFLVHETKIKNALDATVSADLLSRKNNQNLFLQDPSTSDNRIPEFVKKNHSGIGLFQSQSRPFEPTGSGKYYGVHDMETMGICTTVDAVEELCRGIPQYSRTTHHFLLTNKTPDLNLSDGGQMLESAVSDKLKGKSLSEIFNLSTKSLHNQEGSRLLQRLGSSTDSEGRENVRDIKTSAVCLSNESSEETDIMDMDAFQGNHISGEVSSPANKDFERSRTPLTKDAIASAREQIGDDQLNKALPDINQELPDIPTFTSSMNNNMETSTSRTQSLDADHLLSHAVHHEYTKSAAYPSSSLGAEASNKWVKLCKRSTSDIVFVTENSKMGESSSSEKVNQLNKIMKCRKPNSETTTFNQAAIARNRDSSNSDLERKNREVMLSHPWIRRWCHNRAGSSQMPTDTVVLYEPKCSKSRIHDFQRKQFPSIAAMALMGKAMTGVRPCEFTRRGSFLVWNTGFHVKE